MKHLFQNFTLNIYRLIKCTGFLSTRIGQKLAVTGYFIYKKIYEPNLSYLQAMIPPGSTVIDVGANIGFMSLQFANWVSKDGLVIAIEPEPINVGTLNRIVRDKKIINLKIINGAAAEKDGILFLDVNPLNPADHRLSQTGVQIDAFTIDGLLMHTPHTSISLIKIDVQGAELRVLEGAVTTITRHNPLILIEIDDEALLSAGFTPHQLVEKLGDLGYELFDSRINKSREFSEYDHISRKKIGYADYLFIARK
jgi:FkbM family methyltransferase